MRPVNNIAGGQIGRSRLLDLLLRDGRQRLNNGTVAGGLAHVLQQGMRGYQIGQEREAQQKAQADEIAAMNAMTRGMTAQQWQPPAGDTIYDGPNGAPMSPEDAAARAAPAGGYAGGISALQGLGPDNAAAGRLTSQLLMNKMERDQTIADRDEQRAYDEGVRKEEEAAQRRLLERKSELKMKEDAAGGPFSGTGMDAQVYNILLDPNADPSSPTYLAAYNRAAAPKVTFDPATGQQIMITPNMSAFRPPAGMAAENSPMQNAGQTAPLPQQGGVSVSQVSEPTKPMTEGQSNAATYADRMMEADRIIASLGDVGTSFSDKLASEVPMVGNYMVSPEYQKLLQAQRNFVNAVLRKESGAVISDQEFANAAQQYFPQPGDSPEVIRQKAENRTLAIQGIARAAGPTYKPNAQQAPQASAAPQSEQEAASAPVGTIVTSAKGIQYQKVGNTGTPADWKRVDDAAAVQGQGTLGVR